MFRVDDTYSVFLFTGFIAFPIPAPVLAINWQLKQQVGRTEALVLHFFPCILPFDSALSGYDPVKSSGLTMTMSTKLDIKEHLQVLKKREVLKERAADELAKIRATSDPTSWTNNGTLKEMVQEPNGALHATDIPDCFVLPPHLQPGQSPKGDPKDVNLPLIDMSGIDDNPERRKEVVAKIARACNEWGFFQIVGHGVPAELRETMLADGREFFTLPASDKAKFQNCWFDNSKPVLGRSRLTSSGHHSWRDSLRHRAAPVSDAEVEEWPSKPSSYRQTVKEYTEATKKVATTIFQLIAEGLNLNSNRFHEVLGGEDEVEYTLMLGYYPRCPQPDKALGLVGHTDPNLLTFLVQDEPGLEVMKDGLWIPVEPAPNGLVVNIGDTFQIMTNDRYKSVEHRVLASKRRDRASAMIFVQPKNHVNVSVVSELVPSSTKPVYDDIPWGRHLLNSRQGVDQRLTRLALTA